MHAELTTDVPCPVEELFDAFTGFARYDLWAPDVQGAYHWLHLKEGGPAPIPGGRQAWAAPPRPRGRRASWSVRTASGGPRPSASGRARSPTARLIARLLDRLDVELERARRFAANAAHELPTPLTKMIAELEHSSEPAHGWQV